MITLKKSFELQNYYRGLLTSTYDILGSSDVMKTTQTHMRSKAYDKAEDEVIVEPKRNTTAYSINQHVDFSCYLIDEVERLSAAINTAKVSSGYDFDGMIANNKNKRSLLYYLDGMSKKKTSEKIISGIARKFNEEGNQVNYAYEVKSVTEIDFDRNVVKAIVSRLRKELDEVSSKIDKLQIDTMVEYTSIFEIGDDLEEAMGKWIANNEN